MTTFTTEDRKQAEKHREVIRGRCPCDGCNHFNSCKEKEYACRSFAKFVVDNYYYVDAPKDPCKGVFNKVFHQKDDDLLKEFVRQFKEDGSEDNAENNTRE